MPGQTTVCQSYSTEWKTQAPHRPSSLSQSPATATTSYHDNYITMTTVVSTRYAVTSETSVTTCADDRTSA